ncbi:hypothetical protein J21TS3_41910 [Paenibacillus cookii]|uniref:Uncharacterized protein n=2 Tax=Paenibacillus cookii TaxID=157839 RepID=A0ABQ4M1G9_9BACL|nr:hypothetical protein CM49_05918 [Paenibacillus sp. P1XP2]GIO69370.1 hypothetical protein J21TS3_41910 [Paenibacillus cookii]
MPRPAEPVLCADQESVAGKYAARDMMITLDVSFRNKGLYLTVPKMYGVEYTFRLIPVSRDSAQATSLTEMIHEQLVFRFSASGGAEHVEYTDDVGKKRRLFKVGS